MLYWNLIVLFLEFLINASGKIQLIEDHQFLFLGSSIEGLTVGLNLIMSAAAQSLIPPPRDTLKIKRNILSQETIISRAESPQQ